MLQNYYDPRAGKAPDAAWRGPGSRVKGSLNIGYDEVFSPDFLTGAIAKCCTHRPNVQCNVTGYTNAKLMDALFAGDIDCAFTVFPYDHKPLSGLDSKIIGEDTLALAVAEAVSPGHGDFSGIAESLPLLLLDHNTIGANDVMRVLIDLSIVPEFIFLESVNEILVSVESGMGFAILPGSLFTRRKSGLLIMPITGSRAAHISLGICTRAEDFNPILHDFLLQFS